MGSLKIPVQIKIAGNLYDFQVTYSIQWSRRDDAPPHVNKLIVEENIHFSINILVSNQ